MPDEHWTNGFEHESVTDENREAFNTAMSKYDSQEAAIVGGFNAMKIAGQNFKLPKSVESLPDEAMRNDFTSQVHNLFGIKHAQTVEDLKDLDMTVGMEADAEGNKKIDETLATAFKQLVVEKKLNVGEASHYIEMHNKMMAKARRDFAVKQEADKLEAAKATNEALIAHPDIGSEEKLAEQSELLRRAIKNCPGATAEDYEEVGELMADTILTKNAKAARILLKLIAPLAAEGSTEGGGGGGGPTPPKDPDEGSKTYIALGWSKNPNK